MIECDSTAGHIFVGFTCVNCGYNSLSGRYDDAGAGKGDSPARKDDSLKADLSLCPLPALEAMARAFMLGEKKYGRYNYLSGGMESHRLIAATLRHVMQWQSGEDNDPESGYSHLGHALASIAMLISQCHENKQIDTRRKRG
jgi:hypothetical protein